MSLCIYTNVGVALSDVLHIFFDSYSANTKNINVTTLKINVMFFKLLGTIHNILFWLRVKKIVLEQG